MVFLLWSSVSSTLTSFKTRFIFWILFVDLSVTTSLCSLLYNWFLKYTEYLFLWQPSTFALVYVGTTVKDLSDVTHGWDEISTTHLVAIVYFNCECYLSSSISFHFYMLMDAGINGTRLCDIRWVPIDYWFIIIFFPNSMKALYRKLKLFYAYWLFLSLVLVTAHSGSDCVHS